MRDCQVKNIQMLLGKSPETERQKYLDSDLDIKAIKRPPQNQVFAPTCKSMMLELQKNQTIKVASQGKNFKSDYIG